MATAGGLVFQGVGDGFVAAYDAASGKTLWRFNAGQGMVAAPMSYEIGGKQYISILVGYGGSAAFFGDLMNAGWKFNAPRRLLTFALDGRAVLPPSAPADKTVRAVDDPKLTINAADASAGYTLYGRSCAFCHGHELVSTGGPAPDLRESEIALNPDALYSVAHDGVLIQQGMPKFENLTRDQILQIYAYIRSSARDVLKKQGSN
jgi:quinohemoprotein ethanol dehydrogenase